MRVSSDGSYYVRSAFQFAYLVILGVAIYQSAHSALAGGNPIDQQAQAIVTKLGKDAPSVWPATLVIIQIPSFFVRFFIVTFCVHLARIYVTLELMEDMEPGKKFKWYESFYDTYLPLGRFVDFALRALIIAVISLKVIQFDGLKQMPRYVLIFYSVITLWSLNALFLGRKNWRDSFSVSSFSGFAFAICFVVLTTSRSETVGWNVASVLLVVASLALAGNLLYFFYTRGLDLLRIYSWKIFAAW